MMLSFQLINAMINRKYRPFARRVRVATSGSGCSMKFRLRFYYVSVFALLKNSPEIVLISSVAPLGKQMNLAAVQFLH